MATRLVMPQPGQIVPGVTNGDTSWNNIKKLWTVNGDATIVAWTCSPEIANDICRTEKLCGGLRKLVLDRSQGSRNNSLEILRSGLGDRVKLISCHAKIAVCGPLVMVGSGNLSRSKGIEIYQLVNSVELADWWRNEIDKW